MAMALGPFVLLSTDRLDCGPLSGGRWRISVEKRNEIVL